MNKMYSSEWQEDEGMHLQRFLWQDTQDEEICECAITWVNISNQPAGCTAGYLRKSMITNVHALGRKVEL